MKAISLWQPWATLIAVGAKRLETRSWESRYQGELAIHAAKRWTADEQDLIQASPFREALQGHRMPLDRHGLCRGRLLHVCGMGAGRLDRCGGFGRRALPHAGLHRSTRL